MRRSLPFAIFILMAGVQTVVAQDICFCLHDTKYDNWLRDCREIKSGLAPQPRILCYDPKFDHRTEVLPAQDWMRVQEGQPGCKPCAYQLPPGEGDIRGQEGSGSASPSKEKPDGTQ